MDMYDGIVTRRSSRKFKDIVPEKEVLEKIIHAGRVAPSGGNNQSVHFLAITDKSVLDELAAMVREEFSKMEVEPDTYKSLRSAIEASKRGAYVFHYHAPVLVVLANKKNYGNAMADSSCAAMSMMLLANELDLGSCWINQLHWLTENERIRGYLESLGLGEEEWVCASLSIGYVNTEEGLPNRQEKIINGNPVTWIEG